MTPEVSLNREDRQLATVPPLSALLILPVPRTEPKRTVWAGFLRDLSYLLPAFGVGLGYLLLTAQAPFLGAALVTVCPIILLVRIHTAYVARRERKQIAALGKWYREYRCEFENQWKHRYKADCA
jgi:ABC-type Fe3+ transport system permease subunit